MRISPNPFPPGSDEHYVHEALLLAESHMGATSPNPPVGSVLVRDGQIIGRGAHKVLGGRHAEAEALLDAGDASGATCYVSLEPCSHIGRQPSCCHLLAEAGVKRVVWGCYDRDTRSAHRAESVFRELGLEARGGVLREECERFLEHYLLAQDEHRCFTHLKMALSCDAKLACANGQSQWLSGPQSLGLAHYLRWKYDGILVGYRTVLADDPRLTLRSDALAAYYLKPPLASPPQPVRVVLDPRFEVLDLALRNPERFRLTRLEDQRADLPGLIFAGAERLLVERDLPGGWQSLGLADAKGGGLDIADLQVKLYGLGLRSLLVEGGARLAQSLVQQDSLDRISLVYTPVMIGSDGLGFSPALGRSSIAQCPRLVDTSLELLGQDCALHGRPGWQDITAIEQPPAGPLEG